jgi:hypothetical protein
MIAKVYSNSFKMCSMSLRLHGFIPTTFTSNVGGIIFIRSLQMERHMQLQYWYVNGECCRGGESSSWCLEILFPPTFSPSLWLFPPFLPLSNYCFPICSTNSMIVILHTSSWSSSSNFVLLDFFHSLRLACTALNCLMMSCSLW